MDVTFWKWFFFGSGGKAGYKKFLDRWFILHLLIAIVLAIFARDSLSDVASRLLLPLAGVLVGMSFAMTSSFHSILETREINELAEYNPGGYEDYLFTFQLAFLVLFVTLAAWALAGIGIFDTYVADKDFVVTYRSIQGILYFLFSLSLRESWQVIAGTHILILLRKNIALHKKK